MSGWTIAWLLWIAAFLVIEGKALFNKTWDDTLSEHVWKWFSISAKGRWWQLRRFALVAGLGWLCLHFLTGGAF